MARKGKIRKEDILIKERRRWRLFGLPFTFNTYTLTAKKLIVKTGLFNTVEDEILLYRIVDMTVKSTFAQKVFGFGLGSLCIISSDKTSSHLDIKNIRNYKLFRQLLSDQVESERLRVKFRAGEMVDRDAHYGDDVHDDDYEDQFGITHM
ncbi:MAG: PH domain-containing protein [Oscillospiraceae bacterium]|jgi:hypothetical protein|nr:PH domain-containing protein [Oscillospiraceae bacterium]